LSSFNLFKGRQLPRGEVDNLKIKPLNQRKKSQKKLGTKFRVVDSRTSRSQIMVCGTLYTYPDNFRAFKALIAAEYSGAKIKVASKPPEFILNETNQAPEFLSKFPMGKVPAFSSADGTKNISESNAIAYYLANEELRGKSIEDQAFVHQWISFAENELLPPTCTWVFPCMGIMPFNKAATEKAKEDLKRALSALNAHLLFQTYLVGERITLADICVMSNLLLAFKWVLDPEFRAGFNNVTRWFVTMVNQKEVKKVIGDFALCSKMTQFDPKKLAEMTGGKGAVTKETTAEKPAKKEAKPAAQPEEQAASKKDKDPFAAFPKSDFNLDEFKRVYSNEDIKSKAIPYFWDHFDKEHFSIWLCEYKYPEDLGLMFQSENLITGMFQRLDKLNKNAFASVGVFGKSRDAQIQGLWVWRGKDLVFPLSDNWQVDYESYDWHLLDPSSDKTKALVEAFLLHKDDSQEYQPFDSLKHAKYAGHKLYSASILK